MNNIDEDLERKKKIFKNVTYIFIGIFIIALISIAIAMVRMFNLLT